MKPHKLIIVSTAHLHPLEAKEIDKHAYIANEECAMVSTDPDVIDFYNNAGLVLMVEVLLNLRKEFHVEYVIFDPDGDNVEGMKTYDW